jgi:hypothetical protein
MLKFRKINENVKKAEEIMKISSAIDDVVNQWISDLKHEIITGSSIQNRGIWDRFKNFVANVWHGYDNKKNPYYSINKLGYGLGSENKNESLKSYNDLRETCESLEGKINEEDLSNLRIMQIIDKHAALLKTKMKEVLVPVLTASTDAYEKLGKLSYTLSPEEKEIVRRKDVKKPTEIVVPQKKPKTKSGDQTAPLSPENRIGKTKLLSGKKLKRNYTLTSTEDYPKPVNAPKPDDTPKPVNAPKPDDADQPTISTKPLDQGKQKSKEAKYIETIILDLDILGRNTERLKELSKRLPDYKESFYQELESVILRELEDLPSGGVREFYTTKFQEAKSLKQTANLLNALLSGLDPEEHTTNESFSIVGLAKRKILKFRQLCYG